MSLKTMLCNLLCAKNTHFGTSSLHIFCYCVKYKLRFKKSLLLFHLHILNIYKKITAKNVQTLLLEMGVVLAKVQTEFPQMRVLIDERGLEFPRVGVVIVGLR